MSLEVITVKNLSKSFGETRAVEGMTFRVYQQEIFGLVGPDGAGKTTTMRLLTGIMTPSAGEARVMGKHTVREAEALKEEIGYMSQRFGLYNDLSVEENIHFYADLYGVPQRDREAKIDFLLSFSNLKPFRKRLAGKLSGGMKQKLGLICALIHTPRVLFLDEPTSGVDPVSRREFWRILYQLVKEGVTIVLSTTYLDEVERCSRVGLIHHGRLLACDTPEQIKKLMPGTILEVVAPQIRRVASLLRTRLAVESVELFGDRLHLVTSSPAITGQEVRILLQQAGIPLRSLQQVEPTLEDVFVSVLARMQRGEGGHALAH
ncbi:MAG: ABC transporter ATP-binding protein [Nitrospinota bacterium]|nr:MAG: ABC transporter ATP-binding protein [Nitrospinota bacterium]